MREGHQRVFPEQAASGEALAPLPQQSSAHPKESRDSARGKATAVALNLREVLFF